VKLKIKIKNLHRAKGTEIKYNASIKKIMKINGSDLISEFFITNLIEPIISYMKPIKKFVKKNRNKFFINKVSK